MKTFIVHVSVDAESKVRAELIVERCIEDGSSNIDTEGGEYVVVLSTTEEIEE